MSEKLREVSRRSPCPICGRPDWCGVSANGNLCICMRQAEGAKKQSANGGYVHVLRDRPFSRNCPRVRMVRIKGAAPARSDLALLAERCRENVGESAVRDFAGVLGLSVDSLLRLRVGWDGCHKAWTFPMVDANGRVVGIRLRLPDGRKLAVTGGHEGLFIPDGIGFVQPLLLPEGPTDCAALLDWGFDTVARPSCSGGVRLCTELVRAHWPLDAVVVADRDTPGQRGAEALASALLAVARSVRVIQPPDGIKDARAWKLEGATRADVERAIETAPLRELTVRQSTTGKARGR